MGRSDVVAVVALIMLCSGVAGQTCSTFECLGGTRLKSFSADCPVKEGNACLQNEENTKACCDALCKDYLCSAGYTVNDDAVCPKVSFIQDSLVCDDHQTNNDACCNTSLVSCEDYKCPDSYMPAYPAPSCPVVLAGSCVSSTATNTEACCRKESSVKCAAFNCPAGDTLQNADSECSGVMECRKTCCKLGKLLEDSAVTTGVYVIALEGGKVVENVTQYSEGVARQIGLTCGARGLQADSGMRPEFLRLQPLPGCAAQSPYDDLQDEKELHDGQATILTMLHISATRECSNLYDGKDVVEYFGEINIEAAKDMFVDNLVRAWKEDALKPNPLAPYDKVELKNIVWSGFTRSLLVTVGVSTDNSEDFASVRNGVAQAARFEDLRAAKDLFTALKLTGEQCSVQEVVQTAAGPPTYCMVEQYQVPDGTKAEDLRKDLAEKLNLPETSILHVSRRAGPTISFDFSVRDPVGSVNKQGLCAQVKSQLGQEGSPSVAKKVFMYTCDLGTPERFVLSGEEVLHWFRTAPGEWIPPEDVEHVWLKQDFSSVNESYTAYITLHINDKQRLTEALQESTPSPLFNVMGCQETTEVMLGKRAFFKGRVHTTTTSNGACAHVQVLKGKLTQVFCYESYDFADFVLVTRDPEISVDTLEDQVGVRIIGERVPEHEVAMLTLAAAKHLPQPILTPVAALTPEPPPKEGGPSYLPVVITAVLCAMLLTAVVIWAVRKTRNQFACSESDLTEPLAKEMYERPRNGSSGPTEGSGDEESRGEQGG